MIERDPTALNYIIDQNNDRDEPIEIYEYKIKDKKKLNGRFFSAKFSFSGCLLALFVNIIALFVFSALLFAVYLIVVNASLRTYGEFCNKDSDCDTSFQLRCQFGICNCTSDYFHKSITTGCVRKLNNLGSCQLDEQCYGGQYCFNNVCDCSNDRFWNSTTLFCQKKSGYGGFCLNDVNCGYGTNMNCVSSKCGCSDPNVSYWNGTYCAPVQSFMGDCKTNSTCKPSSFLLCNTTELYPNKCACLPYHFWNSASEMCQSMKTVNETCDSSEECLSHTKLFCGLLEGVVYMSVKRCTCQSDHYWSPTSNSCEKKASYGEVCTVCDNTLLLSCNVANYCACDPTHFWNGTFCVLDISNGLNCDNNFDCDSALGLSCDTTYRKCVCASTHYWKDSTCTLKQINGSYCKKDIECQSQNGLSCVSDRCSCPATNFWNINICNVKYDANTYCTETFQCKDYRGLTCINGAGISSKSCQCGTNFYWEQSTQTCNSKKSHGLTCANDYECRDSLGLICASTCLCPYTHYWDSGTCSNKN
ncbi:prion-like-(Q N-rich) domain-bearing 25 [Brachionus plicatilis]|uniref:Prion-like-(Q N-rich) domain-bearing 25 n=1 Tax=Brachionus plicatilis TaxID=10195 RepID=A0A3M7SFK7_BRAPC|nr:prion-like-(Q N-rich) domain-bearing 25 [Brachionus plicatilis]